VTQDDGLPVLLGKERLTITMRNSAEKAEVLAGSWREL